MEINILSQGFEGESNNSVGKKLIQFISQKNFHTFTGITAFMSQSGIYGLSKYIDKAKHYINKIIIVTGIDQKVTSKEALEILLNLNINSYIFYHPSKTIFHPKIYLFEGIEKSELIIGSSNLTSQGLFNNIETSIHLSINNKIESDKLIIKQLKKYFQGIFEFSDPNLRKLSDKLIADLVKLKIVPMEAERELNQDRSENFDKTKTNKILYKIFPKREIPKIPSEFRAKKLKRIKTDIITKDSFGKSIELGKLVWIRKRLPSSSVQGGSAGTNPTGGLRLVQDDFIDENKTIDQTKYFRYKIFGKFNWSEIKKTPLVEVAIVPFKINIFGKYIGEFNLQIRHKPSGEAGQHNYTTSISWGEVSEIIRKANLTGRKLELYKSKGLSKVFQIIIE